MKDLKQYTDEELTDYIRNNDQEAYSEIVLRYQNKLLRYANNLIHDEMKAADVVQNSLIKAFINLNSFDMKKKFSSWLYRIVHNEAINIALKHQKEIPLTEEFDFQSQENIEADIINKEKQTMVQNCLDNIPIIYSEPLSLYYLEEKSYEEISDILRLPINTIGTRISRAKKLMKKICRKI